MIMTQFFLRYVIDNIRSHTTFYDELLLPTKNLYKFHRHLAVH